MAADKPRIIDLPKIYDPRGSLTFVQEHTGVPFDIKRVYWIYDVPGGAERGSHSHIATHEFIVAASGSFNVNLFDGKATQTFHLDSPSQGLYVPPGYWRTLDHFSSGSLCLVIVSSLYDENDYIRDIVEFIKTTDSTKPDTQ